MEERLKCGACCESLGKGSFSSTQWKRGYRQGGVGRCSRCVDKNQSLVSASSPNSVASVPGQNLGPVPASGAPAAPPPPAAATATAAAKGRSKAPSQTTVDSAVADPAARRDARPTLGAKARAEGVDGKKGTAKKRKLSDSSRTDGGEKQEAASFDKKEKEKEEQQLQSRPVQPPLLPASSHENETASALAWPGARLLRPPTAAPAKKAKSAQRKEQEGEEEEEEGRGPSVGERSGDTAGHAGAGRSVERVVEELAAFYAKNCPDRAPLKKAHRRLAVKYQGKEGSMWAFLKRKYQAAVGRDDKDGKDDDEEERSGARPIGPVLKQRRTEKALVGASAGGGGEEEDAASAKNQQHQEEKKNKKKKRKRKESSSFDGDDDHDHGRHHSSSSSSSSGGELDASASSSSSSSSSSSKPAVCDKCDGPHATTACPHFRKGREKHPDAQRRRAALTDMGGAGGNVLVTGARRIRQPGDGSCLFHSMDYGLRRLQRLGLLRGGGSGGGGGGARMLRREIAQWLVGHPNAKISDTPVKQWVKWDSGLKLEKYAQRMARGGCWGGGIELAGCSLLRGVNVHVYERRGGGGGGGGGGGFLRISCFGDAPKERTVHVVYCGGVHYDALEVHDASFHKLPEPRKAAAAAARQQHHRKRARSLSFGSDDGGMLDGSDMTLVGGSSSYGGGSFGNFSFGNGREALQQQARRGKKGKQGGRHQHGVPFGNKKKGKKKGGFGGGFGGKRRMW